MGSCKIRYYIHGTLRINLSNFHLTLLIQSHQQVKHVI